MFTFINLSILTALLAISLPLLIHLFNRQRKKNILFSSLRFLKFLEKQRLKRLKLYEYLLIIIRTLVILMLVLAFARPTLTTKPIFSSQGARTTAVIILDSGINMRRYDESGNRYSRSLDVLNQIRSNYKPEDQVFIILSSNPGKVLTNTGEIHDPQASYQESDWTSSFKTTLKLFEDHPNFNEELIIISDFQFQQNSFKSYLQQLSDTHKYFVKIGTKPIPNIGIDSVETKSQILEQKKPVNLEISLRSSNLEKPRTVEIHMFVNDKRVSHRRIIMESKRSEIIPMSFVPQYSGFTTGYVEISDDDLLADNRYYFAVNIPKEIKILFVDDMPSPFLVAALQSLSQHSNITIMANKYNNWSGQNFQKYDVIWLSNIPNISVQIQNRLKSFLEKGGSLIFLPGLKTVPSDFNVLTKKLDLQVQLTEKVQTKNFQEFYSINQPDLDHPLFNELFRGTDPKIEDARFYQYYKTKTPVGSKRILSFQNGDPFLIQLATKTGASFLFSSYINDDWTDFQYRGLFLPMLSRLMYFGVSASSQVYRSSKVGKQQIVVTKSHKTNSKFFVQDSEGNRSTIVPRMVDQNHQFKLTRLKKPGLYQIYSESQLISVIPVNCDMNTLNEPFLDLESITDSVPQVELFNENQDFAESVQNSRYGMELWKWFIIFSLILIFVELFFIKNMEGKRAK